MIFPFSGLKKDFCSLDIEVLTRILPNRLLVVPNENVEKILTVICQIPKGSVATYGQIAKIAGIPRNARQVGRVLRDLSDASVPWHRVVNSKGEISRGNATDTECTSIQREALEEEKVAFDAKGRVLLSKYQWQPGRKTKSK